MSRNKFKNRNFSSSSDSSETEISRSSLSSSHSSSSYASRSSILKSEKSHPKLKKSKSTDSARSRESRSSRASFSSLSDVSSHGSQTKLSRTDSYKNLEAEYQPVSSNLPLNVYQALFSIKNSNLKIYTLTKEFHVKLKSQKTRNFKPSIFVYSLKDNSTNLKQSIEEKPMLVEANKKIAESILTECYGAISLVEVLYGSIHWKLAKERTNLALIYLEIQYLPKQAKLECEKVWSILVEDVRNRARLEPDQPDYQLEFYPDYNKHQLIVNYIYGRASTLLKE